MKRIRILLLLIFMTTFGFAQNVTINGRVVDEDGEGIISATVQAKAESVGTVTDLDGNFTLDVNSVNTIINVSYIGYDPVEYTAGVIPDPIILSINTAQLEDVIVVGYGTQGIGNQVGSVVTVSGETVNGRPSANVLDALQGQVPGVQVFSSSGEPSATPSLRIHGSGSLGASSTPYYLLDGFPIGAGTFASLNPRDIESVTVLKDASSTSIYGSQAANGVVFITSKKGSRNRSEIKVNSQYSFSNLANTDPFETFMNTKQLTDFWIDTGYRSEAFVADLLDRFPNDTEWYKYYYKEDAPVFEQNVSFSGGNEKTRYFVSGSYFDSEGLAYRSDFNRYTLRTNVDSEIKDWLTIGARLSFGYDERQTNQYGSNSTNRGLAPLAQPFYTPFDEDGNDYQGVIPGWGRYNPRYLADKLPSLGKNIQMNPNGFIRLTPIKNLTLNSQAGIEYYNYTQSSNRLPSFIGNSGDGTATERTDQLITQTITNTIEYLWDVNDEHGLSFLAGHEFINNDFSRYEASSTGQNDDRLILLSQGPNNPDVSQSKSEYVFQSFFGRATYSYDSKYSVEGTVRRDGSSRFGEDNRHATFWSTGLRWNMKNENFLANSKVVNDLILRTSYGTSGNAAIGNYNSLALVGTSQYGGNVGWNVNAPGNPELQWESQNKYTISAEARLFNRVSLDVEYYNRKTEDMLIDVPQPRTIGFGDITQNVGSLTNKGFDVGLRVDVIGENDLGAFFTPYINANYNKNEVTELFQGRDYWIIPNTGVSWAVGQPVSFFYPIYKGVNPANGQPEWYLPNENPDEIINTRTEASAVTSQFSSTGLQQNTGIARQPNWNGGFGFSSGIKGFTVNADFSYSANKYLINNSRFFFENPTVFGGFNQSNRVNDYWKEPGDQTLFPDYDNYQFTQFDSSLLEDASFIRLKQLNVAYNLPKTVMEKTKVFQGVRVYFIGRNLLTFTDYLGEDPEVDSNLALGTNPNTKQAGFGIDLTF